MPSSINYFKTRESARAPCTIISNNLYTDSRTSHRVELQSERERTKTHMFVGDDIPTEVCGAKYSALSNIDRSLALTAVQIQRARVFNLANIADVYIILAISVGVRETGCLLTSLNIYVSCVGDIQADRKQENLVWQSAQIGAFPRMNQTSDRISYDIWYLWFAIWWKDPRMRCEW